VSSPSEVLFVYKKKGDDEEVSVCGDSLLLSANLV
jgi:hypothetical protein